MSTGPPGDLDALRAAVARLQAGGSPHHPPRSSPHLTPRGGDRPGSSDRPAGDPDGVAKAIVLRLLTNAPKTRAQLERALAARGCDPDVARRVLDRLTEVGLVDDRAYAEVYVRSKQHSRALSKAAVRRELLAKGVGPETTDDVLDSVSEADEEERARALVTTRLPRLHGLERMVQVRRLANLLARKGYPPGLASRVVFEEIDRAAEHRRD